MRTKLALLLSTIIVAITISLLLPPKANAGFASSISFTDQEREQHVQSLPLLLSDAAKCLSEDLKHHQDFYRAHGISAFYGDRSSFAKLSHAERRNLVAGLGKSPSLVDQMQPTSCVGLTMKCLGRGFKTAGQADLWHRLVVYTDANGVDGTALQDGLQKLGWKILYWNPDVSRNREWDQTEREEHPDNHDSFWGQHEANWRSIKDHDRYYLNRVDDRVSLVDFDNHTPEALKKVPFFVGTAHMGYHVFPGSFGVVTEGHSTRQITDPKTLQSAWFNPLEGGAPTDGEYRSGIIAVPPGYTP